MEMCDYSLSATLQRAAKVGDKMISTWFNHSTTGMAAVGERGPVAVCMRPGTEVAFDEPIRARRHGLMGAFGPVKYEYSVGRFRQVELEIAHTHHDALELPDGSIVKINELEWGQRCTVLQLGLEAPVPEDHAAVGASTRSDTRTVLTEPQSSQANASILTPTS